MDIQGCFTSTYKFYKLFMGGFSSQSTAYTEIGFLDSSNNHMTSTYYSIWHGTHTNSGVGNARWSNPINNNQGTQNDTDGFRIINTWTHENGSTGFEGQSIEMYFYDPNITSKQIVIWNANFSQLNYCGLEYGVGMQDTVTAKHGLRLAMHTGNFTGNGHFAVYGYKM